MLEHYYSLSKNPQKHFRLLDLQELIDGFELRLKEAPNKKAFTRDEQFFIDSSFHPVNNGGVRGMIRSSMGEPIIETQSFMPIINLISSIRIMKGYLITPASNHT